MGMSVNTNIAAMNAYRNLSQTNDAMSKSLERLSSGFRINKASDDAAGLAISEGLRSQIGGMTQAVRNTQDGTSVVQTAEGALNETTSILQRMRDLSVQAANGGGLNADAKASIQKEVKQLKSELTRIADTTTFNGTKLLDGNYDGTFQVGANSGETIGVKIGSAMSAAGLSLDTVDVSTGGPTWTFDPGAVDFAAAAAPTLKVNPDASGDRTLDLTGWDTSKTTDAAAKNKALVQSAFDTSLNGSGYNVTVGDFGDIKATGPTGSATGDLAFTGLTGTATFNATAGSGADAALNAIDLAIKKVSGVRADLGAIQNRFEHTVNNLNVAIENTTASESRIRDTDMASEMTSFTRAQVLTQAGTSMLAQANQSTQSILKLLG
jgi:flagellin